MPFSKEQVKAAKQGTHWIAWAPGQKHDECTVLKVRGDFVWVAFSGLKTKLNTGASARLIAGEYRKPPL